jgi:glycosyltransferase involved in cell wall biosynthesis
MAGLPEIGEAELDIAPERLPSISVVIPCRNAERWVADAIQSVLDQNYPKLEIIVIDDGSTDNSLKVIQSFGDRIRWETGSNLGACAARNRGLALCRSDYVAFLDADDYVQGPLFMGQALAARSSSADFCMGCRTLEFPDGRRLVIEPFDHRKSAADILSEILAGQAINSVLWRVEFLQQIGGWDTAMLRYQDRELFCRALLHAPRLASSRRGTVVYVQHGSPARITSNVSAGARASEICHYEKLAAKMPNTEFASSLGIIGKQAYILAVKNFGLGYVDNGERALALARKCGFRGHVGSIPHIALSTILGLRTKERLSAVVRRARLKNL